MDTAAAVSSLPRSASTPDVLSAREEAVAARFGFGVFAFGPFVVKALERHLERQAVALPAVQVKPAAASPAVVDELEAASRKFRLRAIEAEATGGAEEQPRTRDQLAAMLEHCAGEAPSDASARHALSGLLAKEYASQECPRRLGGHPKSYLSCSF